MSNNRASGLAVALATWFGCGYSPVAPGTVGSFAAVAIAFAVNLWLPLAGWHLLLAGCALIPAGIWAADAVARAEQKEDPGMIVIDEVIGQWITLGGALSLTPKSWLLSFVLFRLLDVWKPFPARKLEDLHGGNGVVADDVMAGVYGALIMYLAGHFGLY